MKTMVYDIGDYGAVGDGRSKNTVAIQTAIDRCYADGGGRVVVPPGEFVTGTIFLKDNVEFHLVAGSAIRGSSDLEDYNKDDCFEQNVAFSRENVTGAHLIIAHEVKNVSITGLGTIDGNSQAFFGEIENGKFNIKDKRPGQMIYFCECDGVRVEGVSLNNAPYWTCFIHGCENVFVRGLKIENPRETRNGDGIDVDCCRNVAISDCVIYSGDDCITLRGSNRSLKNKSRACENVTVTNCILSTPCNALRIGVGDGMIRNCAFSNIVVVNTRNGINIVSKYARGQSRGVNIRNIRFSNFIMDTIAPFYVVSGWDTASRIEGIHFSGITASASKTSCVHGNKNVKLRNIQFKDVEIEVTGGKDFMVDEEIDTYVYTQSGCPSPKGLNTVFLIGKSEDVDFKDLKIKWKDIDAPWRYCFKVKDCENIDIPEKNLSVPPGENLNQPVEIL